MGIERIGLPVAIEGDAALDADTNVVAHGDKIPDRAEMDIGRLVPRVCQKM
jgi:hypothetical protein